MSDDVAGPEYAPEPEVDANVDVDAGEKKRLWDFVQGAGDTSIGMHLEVLAIAINEVRSAVRDEDALAEAGLSEEIGSFDVRLTNKDGLLISLGLSLLGMFSTGSRKHLGPLLDKLTEVSLAARDALTDEENAEIDRVSAEVDEARRKRVLASLGILDGEVVGASVETGADQN